MDSGVYRPGALQPWQREHILAAASFLRERFGNPPTDPRARVAHDSLLEVLDPVRRTTRMQKETNSGASTPARPERRETDRRQSDRRKKNVGPPAGTPERRKGERRRGSDRRARS